MISLTSLVLASHGFGLNTNLFETNIINLIIVIVVLVWFLRGFVGGILQRRREAILVDLKDAEERLLLANRALELGQQELAQAQVTAGKILEDGKQRSILIREDSERRTIEEMVRIKGDAVANLNAEAARVVDALRAQTAKLAVEKALASLPAKLNDAAQVQLIDRSIDALGEG